MYWNLTLNFLGLLFASVIGMFVFWRRLYRDLPEPILWKMIFQIYLVSLISGHLFWLLKLLGLAGWEGLMLGKTSWLWQIVDLTRWEVWGGVLGAMVVVRNFRKISRSGVVSEIGDALIESFGWTILIFNLYVWPLHSWTTGGIGVMVVIVGMVLWYWLKNHYRKFRWYLSGKVGFLWWAGIGLLAVGQLIVAPIPEFILGRIGQLVYNLIPITLCIIGIYQISGRDFQNDGGFYLNYLNLVKLYLYQKYRKLRMKLLKNSSQTEV